MKKDVRDTLAKDTMYQLDMIYKNSKRYWKEDRNLGHAIFSEALLSTIFLRVLGTVKANERSAVFDSLIDHLKADKEDMIAHLERRITTCH